MLIKDFDGVKKWNDGSTATSCKEYKFPSAESGYVYGGQAGSGLYEITLGAEQKVAYQKI